MPRSELLIRANDKPTEIRAAGKLATIRAAETPDADGKPKLRRFDGNAYTGAPMEPGGWYGSIIVDLAGVRVPSQHRPVLRQHDDEQIVGHTETIKVTDKGVEIAGVCSGEEQHVAKVTKPADNGFQWQLSIGASPIRTEFLEAGATATVNGREVTGPMTISRETELKEVSFVPLGADGDTSVSVSASRGRLVMFKAMLVAAKKAGNVKAAKYGDEDIDKMSEDEAKGALKKCMAEEEDKPKPKADAEEDDEEEEEEKPKAKAKAEDEDKKEAKASAKRMKARREKEAAEEERIDAIRIKAKGHPKIIARAIREEWSEDRTELEVVRAARPGANVGGVIVNVVNTPEASEAVLECAILHAHRHTLKLQDDDFYFEPTPDGKGRVRRVPQYLQQEAQHSFTARYPDQVQQAAHTMFKGRIGLHQLLEMGMRANGSTSSLDFKSQEGIRSMMKEWDYLEGQPMFRAEGASNVSMSNVLANVMNKFSLQGYLFTEQAWREICAIRPVNDFKATKSINLLGDVMFKAIGPTGELDNASLGDQAFANQAAPYGRILTIPWTHIVNDDLGILGQVPMKIGQGAGLALNDMIWALKKAMYAGTVNGDDGTAFYRTTSLTTAAAMKAGKAYKPNMIAAGAGSALSATSLQTAKGLFDNQIDPNGNPLGFDGLTPILLHGPSNWQTVSALMMAPTIVYGGASAALQPGTNVWAGQAKPVMSRYMENANYVNSATAWELLFNPVALATIEVAFLNGTDTPTVLQAGPDYQFDRLGITIRGTMSMGANAQNFRGGVFSPGA